MQELGTELRGLATAVLSGMTMVCAYVCIRNLRKVFRHSRILVNVEDAVYWICMAWYLFEQIYHVSNGVIRWYFVVGIIVGAAVFYTVEKRIRKQGKQIRQKKKKNSLKTIEIDYKKR